MFHTGKTKYKLEYQGIFTALIQLFRCIKKVVTDGDINVFLSIIRISYCPKSVGKYAIHVLDSEQNTAGKPIKVDVFDPNMIKLSKIGDAVLGQDNRIRVDTGK